MSTNNPPASAFERISATISSGGDLARFEEDRNSNRIFVVFSHVDIPAGKFAQSRAVSHLPGSKIFLNCLDNKWYSDGIDKFSEDIPTTVENLLSLVEDFDPFFVGHSMGAYLSLICGNICENAKFVSTSPELFLGLPGSRSFRNDVRGRPAWGNVEDLRDKFHSKPNGVTLFGAYDPIDCYFLSDPEKLSGLGRVYEMPHHHGVTEYMTHYKFYDHFLSGVGENKRDESRYIAREHFAPVGTFGTPEQYRHFYEAFWAYSNSRSDKANLRKFVSEHSNWINPGWQELRSKIFYTLGENANSLTAAFSAYAFQPNLMQFIDTYANACFRMQDAKRICDLIDGLDREQRAHNVGVRVINRAHKAFGKLFRMSMNASNDVEPDSVENTLENDGEAPAAYPFSEYGAPSIDNDPEIISKIHQAISVEDYEYILGATTRVSGNEIPNTELLAIYRSLALVMVGDKAAAIRALRASDIQTNGSRRTARICLDVAYNTRSAEFIEAYLNMELDTKVRKLHAKRLSRTLEFVTDPDLISKIVIELSIYHNDLERALSRLYLEARKHGTLKNIAETVIEGLQDKQITFENKQDIAVFLSKCGLRTTALSWSMPASTSSGLQNLGQSQQAYDLLYPLLPTKADYMQQETAEESK